MSNLLNHPAYKIEDRKAILQRTYDALLNDSDAVLDFRGGTHRYTKEELANWEARQTIANILNSF